MENKTKKRLQYFVIIGSQKSKNKFLKILQENGAYGIETVYGRGSVNAGVLARAFGFKSEQEKVLITCLMDAENARKLINVLYEQYQFDQPNTGIAFGIPVEGLLF